MGMRFQLLIFLLVKGIDAFYELIMSAGDSITAGLGGRWTKDDPFPRVFVFEDCGISFATGGDADAESLAKLIESEERVAVQGKSYGSRSVKICIDKPSNRVFCPRDPLPIRMRRRADGYNVAMTGSTAESLHLQFEELKARIEEDKRGGSLRGGRGLLTLLIGANDLCLWDCRRPTRQLEAFEHSVRRFIDLLQAYFSDQPVQLDILVALLPRLEGIPLRAKGTLMEAFSLLECPCAYSNDKFGDRVRIYNEKLELVAAGYRNVKVTSVLTEKGLEDWPEGMTSPLDAFHPSKLAHSYFAKKIYEEMKQWGRRGGGEIIKANKGTNLIG